MDLIKNNWKALLALVLVLISILVLMMGYAPKKLEFETQSSQISNQVVQLEMTISDNLRYEAVQSLLEPAANAVDKSRAALYRRFPAELKEEDQIMYVLYLEEKFGTEIMFNFGTVSPIARFTDGAVLNGLSLTVNYESSYDGFKDMINYLATDERVTSIQYATMTYDAENDLVTGNLTLLLYMVDSSLVDYSRPNITRPEQGKDNIFEGSVLTVEDVKNQTDESLGGNATNGSGGSGSETQTPNNSAEGVIPGYVDSDSGSSGTGGSTGSSAGGSTVSTSEDGKTGYGNGVSDDGTGYFEFVWGM